MPITILINKTTKDVSVMLGRMAFPPCTFQQFRGLGPATCILQDGGLSDQYNANDVSVQATGFWQPVRGLRTINRMHGVFCLDLGSCSGTNFVLDFLVGMGREEYSGNFEALGTWTINSKVPLQQAQLVIVLGVPFLWVGVWMKLQSNADGASNQILTVNSTTSPKIPDKDVLYGRRVTPGALP